MTTFRNLRWDLHQCRLWVNGREQYLSMALWRLFIMFAEEPNQTHTYQTIIERIDTAGGKRSVFNCINRLRKIVGSEYIVSVSRVGYRFLE